MYESCLPRKSLLHTVCGVTACSVYVLAHITEVDLSVCRMYTMSDNWEQLHPCGLTPSRLTVGICVWLAGWLGVGGIGGGHLSLGSDLLLGPQHLVLSNKATKVCPGWLPSLTIL